MNTPIMSLFNDNQNTFINFYLIEQVQGYLMHSNKECHGNDFIGRKNAVSPLECALICDQTAECVAFVFDEKTTSQNCYCKNKCDSLTVLTSVNTYVKGIHLYYP
jgi:hypothetical protein